MIKYVDTKVVFSEIPDEVTLAINISQCPCCCRGCHSPYLWKNIGEDLTIDVLVSLVKKNDGITCVAIMGGDNDPAYVNYLSYTVHDMGLKYAWYSGRNAISNKACIRNFDYIKIGPYISYLGSLTAETTNQRMYKVEGGDLKDITYLFYSKLRQN